MNSSMFDSFLALWLGFVLIRMTTLKHKNFAESPIWIIRAIGFLFIFFHYVSVTQGIRFALFSGVMVIASWLDLARYRKLGISIFKKPERTEQIPLKKLLSLITWDMWLITIIFLIIPTRLPF